MSSPYAMFGTDSALEAEKGVTIDYGPFSITILRAGGSNRKYKNVTQREYRKRKHAIDSEQISEEESAKMLAEVYAESVIIGWKGVQDETGKDMKCSKANVVKLLTDLPELFHDIRSKAVSIELFRKAELEIASGNS